MECRLKDPVGICREKAKVGVWKEGDVVTCTVEKSCPRLVEKRT